MLERRQRVPAHLGQLVEARPPGRQPAMPALECGKAQLWVPIEDPGSDQRRHVALGVPHVAGGALQKDVIPGIPHAGRIGSRHGEGVDDHRQVVLLRHRPDGLPAGVVQRHVGRADREDANRPVLLAAATHLGHRGGDLAARDQDDAGQSVRIGRAVVLQKAVIGLVHGEFQGDVVQRTERRHTPGREDHVHIDALDIHVAHAGVGIEADALARKRRALPAHVPGGAAILHTTRDGGRGLHPLPRAQAAVERGALSDLIPGHPAFGRSPLHRGAECRQLGAIGGREIRLDGLDGLDDVGVRVEDAIPRPRHQRFLRS